jgi:hypothetical protein
MYIPIETKETYNGKQYIMQVGLVKGRNHLLRNGWEYCTNGTSLTNGRNTGSYNRFMKCWSFDNDILNITDHCTYLNEQSLTMQNLRGK